MSADSTGSMVVDMDGVKVHPVPTESIEDVWERVVLQFTHSEEKVRLSDYISASQLLDELHAGRNQLWLVYDHEKNDLLASIITEVVETKIIRACNVIGLASEAKFLPRVDWISVITEIEKWAKEVEQCDEINVEGREAWRRLLKPHGYEFKSVTIGKRL